MNHINFSNHFLIAMPGCADSVFHGAVVYICEHNRYGALGVTINKASNMTVNELLDKVDISVDKTLAHTRIVQQSVLSGGPVQDDRGVVLHASSLCFSSTLKVTDQVAYTTSRDVLESIASGEGPHQFLVSLGYAGWEKGQLEHEIAHNEWLIVEASPEILFKLPVAERYAGALKLLGVDTTCLCCQVGHA
jgi:putative transcriptional regulator